VSQEIDIKATNIIIHEIDSSSRNNGIND
jgi:hypothetical protein